MTVWQTLGVLIPALAVAAVCGGLFVLVALGSSSVPAHHSVGVLQPRPADQPGDEYTALMGGKAVNEPGGAGGA